MNWIMQYKWPIYLMIGGAILSMIVPSMDAFARRTPKKERERLKTDKPFILSSRTFAPGGDVPSLYTCDGKDISPPLQWENPPLGTQSFVLICHDPDAFGGRWVHWIVFNIPPATRSLEQQINVTSINAQLGTNSWREAAYGGPCPPLKKHRYIFTVYALDKPTLGVVSKKPNYKQVMRAMSGHIINKTTLIGMYQRMRNK